MNAADRATFDRCFDRVLDGLPPGLRRLIEQDLVVLVDDTPSADVLREFADEGEALDAGSLLGLHTGVPMTERSVEDHALEPPTIHLFRVGLIAEATDAGRVDEAVLGEQIRITLLHEIGHHYGLEEDELDRLGYG